MKTAIKKIFSIVTMLMLLGSNLAFINQVVAEEIQSIQAPEKVRICHATESNENPYNSIFVNKNSNVSGHKKHKADIIPPFEYKTKK